jgi:hypothetical protein
MRSIERLRRDNRNGNAVADFQHPSWPTPVNPLAKATDVESSLLGRSLETPRRADRIAG